MIKNPKKSQFIIFSVLYFTILLLFIYSLETQNYYIPSREDIGIVETIVFETCFTAKHTNGTYLESRLDNLSQNIVLYCQSVDSSCNLSINALSLPLPSNKSLINYTLFEYTLELNFTNKQVTKTIIC